MQHEYPSDLSARHGRQTMSKQRVWMIGAALLAVATGGAVIAKESATSAAIAAALAAPDRTKADTDHDADRKPAVIVAFAGVKPGDKVGDLIPGRGYFTRIFSHLVGEKGHVYAIAPGEMTEKNPKAGDGAKALAADPALKNVSAVLPAAGALTAPEPLDVAFTAQNYHDVYGYFGADKAAEMNAAIFKMLKPGGRYLIEDHAAPGLTDRAVITKIHRIDQATVKAQVLAAGFVFAGESIALHNPADTHDKSVFDPLLRGKTDQFVMVFRKPR
jgi:predicted methyltransferase